MKDQRSAHGNVSTTRVLAVHNTPAVARLANLGALVLAAMLLLPGNSLLAQRILHDSARDKTAQDSESAAKDITSGDLFTKMLHNADLQAKQNIDSQMDFVRQEMRAKMESFTYWEVAPGQKDAHGNVVSEILLQVGHLANGQPYFLQGVCQSVSCELKSAETRINEYLKDQSMPDQKQVEQKLKELAGKKNQLEQELKELQAKAGKDPFIVQVFSLLDNHGKDALAYAKKIADFAETKNFQVKGVSTALNKIGDGLDQTLSLYKALKGSWEGKEAVSVEPGSLRPPKEQIDLQLLALEQDHLKTMTQIQARKELELGVALDLLKDAQADVQALQQFYSVTLQESIEESLRKAVASAYESEKEAESLSKEASAKERKKEELLSKAAYEREKLVAMLDTLHAAAAAIAEEDAAGRLAALRLSSEERLYSIRKSAVNSSTYDLTIQAATQRLALYWKGGIKPEDLAQWAFYVANTAGVAAIAAK